MKKILFLMLLVMSLAYQSNAQRATLLPTILGDTVSASSGLDTVSKVIMATAGYSAFGVQVNATKVSGTVSAKAYLYGSLDGSNYTVTDSSAAFADQTTNVAVFTKVTTPYTHYKVQVRPATGAATTQVVGVKVYYVFRKHD
jgi:hypothetical protein